MLTSLSYPLYFLIFPGVMACDIPLCPLVMIRPSDSSFIHSSSPKISFQSVSERRTRKVLFVSTARCFIKRLVNIVDGKCFMPAEYLNFLEWSLPLALIGMQYRLFLTKRLVLYTRMRNCLYMNVPNMVSSGLMCVIMLSYQLFLMIKNQRDICATL